MSDKKFLFEAIDAQRAELCSMADQIFDNPEYEGEEVFAMDSAAHNRLAHF